jgi:hypothetical protein
MNDFTFKVGDLFIGKKDNSIRCYISEIRERKEPYVLYWFHIHVNNQYRHRFFMYQTLRYWIIDGHFDYYQVKE